METLFDKIERLKIEQANRYSELIDNLAENDGLRWNDPYMFTTAIGDVDPCDPRRGPCLEKALESEDPYQIGMAVIELAKWYVSCEVEHEAARELARENGVLK